MTGAWVVADDVGYEVRGDVVYVARLPDGPLLVLDGPAALIWVEARSDAPGTLAQRVADASGASVADIEGDIEAFTADLVAAGLLRPEADIRAEG